MFDVGFSELLVIALVGLVVLGPKRLPEVARAAGRWTAKLRRFVSDVKQDFDREMRNAELLELQKLKQELDDTRRVMEDASTRLVEQIGTVPLATNTIAMPAPSTAPAVADPAPEAKRSKKKSSSRKSKQASVTQRSHGRARKRKRTQGR